MNNTLADTQQDSKPFIREELSKLNLTQIKEEIPLMPECDAKQEFEFSEDVNCESNSKSTNFNPMEVFIKEEVDLSVEMKPELEAFQIAKNEASVSLEFENKSNSIDLEAIHAKHCANFPQVPFMSHPDPLLAGFSSFLDEFGVGSSDALKNDTSPQISRIKMETPIYCHGWLTDVSLQDHLCTDRKNVVITCDKCQMQFLNKSAYNTHIRLHAGKKPFHCEHCKKSFSVKSHLRIHMRIHSGEKPFTCNQCQKSFSDKSTFNRHVRMHLGKKPFTCEQCQKSFAQRAHLNSHLVFHSGDRPFSCEQCQKTFSLKSHLNRHLIFHSGIRPFTCEHCSKTFSLKSHLNRHLLVHTKEKIQITDE